jgi:hypothetical protein
MTIKADDNDIRVEADRTDYLLQVSNRPFDQNVHSDKIRALQREIGRTEWQKSVDHLQKARGHADEVSDTPEIDPLLVSCGEEFHPQLHKALLEWGHTEATDGLFVEDDRFRMYKPTPLAGFWMSLFAIHYDPMTYFAPFADYRLEPVYQPYYRRYPIKWGDKKEETLFTQKDRIRLVASIVQRHINTDALEASKFLVCEMFALHDRAALAELRRTWALNWKMVSQPLHKIRFYFGEKIAIYFAWLEFYTKMLILPTIAGIITFGYLEGKRLETGENQGYILIAFAAFVVIWSSVFSESWKRKNGILDALWGLHGFHAASRFRAQFRGTKSYNPITDEEEMTFESKARRRRALGISILVVVIMVVIVLVALFALFLLKHWINKTENLTEHHIDLKYKSALTLCVTGANAIQILILNTIYRGVAQKLNEWENHRTESEFENHLVIKVFLFQFCNSFASFFYIAFVKRTAEGTCLYKDDCMMELRDQLLVLFLIRIVVGNTLEVVIPALKYRYQMFRERKALDKAASHNYIEEQAKLVPYESNEAFEDYNEMVIQYGFINLFVVAFPLAPLMALLNNVLEVHVDAVKVRFLLFSLQGPFPCPLLIHLFRRLSLAAVLRAPPAVPAPGQRHWRVVLHPARHDVRVAGHQLRAHPVDVEPVRVDGQHGQGARVRRVVPGLPPAGRGHRAHHPGHAATPQAAHGALRPYRERRVQGHERGRRLAPERDRRAPGRDHPPQRALGGPPLLISPPRGGVQAPLIDDGPMPPCARVTELRTSQLSCLQNALN